MIIKDGSGAGYTLQINSENRALTQAVTTPGAHHVNLVHQKSFSLPFDAIDPVGADDYFLYLKNTGTKNIHVENFAVRSTVAGSVEVHYVTGTAAFTASTAITPVNHFVGSTASITATINTDTDTTGLTNGGVLCFIRCAVADTTYKLSFDSHIIIPPGQAIALLWDTATGALSGNLNIFEQN